MAEDAAWDELFAPDTCAADLARHCGGLATESDVDADAAYALELDRAEQAQPPQQEEEWVTSTSRRRNRGKKG